MLLSGGGREAERLGKKKLENIESTAISLQVGISLSTPLRPAQFFLG